MVFQVKITVSLAILIRNREIFKCLLNEVLGSFIELIDSIHLFLVSTRLLWLHLLVTQMYGMQSWKILLSVVSSNHNSQVILIPIQCVLVL